MKIVIQLILALKGSSEQIWSIAMFKTMNDDELLQDEVVPGSSM